ncbi:ABC transporter substrate-binding protein [Paracoccus ferrooxidans]|uniref:ABC transporter substrate-binding protein n=1 Tax=Paracoccus versutus TaxID=34007 RepID=UPI001FB83A98|nr:ABC transporter substrate-binding protein [Paracoccus versutus]MCJ1902969.1 ABC transporter substrate-binding protein [Paracoccus versutus]WGR59318.1 ABC transporter substrate-binding protein [Paracoccus ferrooxidans]
MKKLLILTTALAAAASAAHADITVISWGGAYEKSQVEAYNRPFTAQTGIAVKMLAADNPAAPIKSMVESNNVGVDVADVEYTDAIRLCDDGLLEEIDPAILPPAPDGTPATEDFLPGALTDCAVGSMVFSTVYGYDVTKFPDEKPSTIADFFDTEKFPGKRGMRKSARANLEMALMAEGVPAAEVYDVLATPEGLDRAFAKLDTIKRNVVWWEAGAQPPQLLADGEVVMTTAYNGRLFTAVVTENKPFAMVWDGQVYEYELFVIPKGAPNKDAALEYIKFATDTQRLADQTKWISYGPARKSSLSLVGLYEDGKTEMAPHMPTAEANLANALRSSYEFWVDRDIEINERFSTWLAE